MSLACAGADKEKVTRATLKAATERALSRSAYVLLDSINGIKGYRCSLRSPSGTCHHCCICPLALNNW